MDRQSAPPGPEFGWAFGGLGFVVTVAVGWLLDAGIGFVLFAVVFWGGMGALFAFLVERSTIEENDRLDELQNTRLATLAPASGPLLRVAPEDASTATPVASTVADRVSPTERVPTADPAPAADRAPAPERAPAADRAPEPEHDAVPDDDVEPAPRTPRERREAERRRRAAA